MIADTPQRAIFDESARYHRFLEYRVGGVGGLGGLDATDALDVSGATAESVQPTEWRVTPR